MAIHGPPSFDEFDPLRGYQYKLKHVWHMHRTDILTAIPQEELARNAYYQGFVTEFEYQHLVSGKGVFHEDGKIRWIIDLPGKKPGPYPDEKLTAERIEMIVANHLLGIGDGDVSF